MPWLWWGLGGMPAETETQPVPGVNRGRKRGVTKSAKPRRKR